MRPPSNSTTFSANFVSLSCRDVFRLCYKYPLLRTLSADSSFCSSHSHTFSLFVPVRRWDCYIKLRATTVLPDISASLYLDNIPIDWYGVATTLLYVGPTVGIIGRLMVCCVFRGTTCGVDTTLFLRTRTCRLHPLVICARECTTLQTCTVSLNITTAPLTTSQPWVAIAVNHRHAYFMCEWEGGCCGAAAALPGIWIRTLLMIVVLYSSSIVMKVWLRR